MKTLLSLLLTLSAFHLSAQHKKNYYFDENLIAISEKAYWADQDLSQRLHLNYDVDTAIIYVKVNRHHHGKLTRAELDLIRKDLMTGSNKVIDSTQIIVIDYYPGKDTFNASGTTDRTWIKDNHEKYLRALHAITSVAQFNIYSKSEGLERYKGIVDWKPDVNNRIKDTFFPLHYPAGSVVVIRPDGVYADYRGEYSSNTVLEMVNALGWKSPYLEKLGALLDRGTISQDVLKMIRKDLEKTSGAPIDTTTLLVIDFHSGRSRCNYKDCCSSKELAAAHVTYLKSLHSVAPITHFNIYNKKAGLGKTRDVYNWKPDINHSINNTFSKTPDQCLTTVIIRPDGNYAAVYTRLHDNDMCILVKQLADKKAN